MLCLLRIKAATFLNGNGKIHFCVSSSDVGLLVRTNRSLIMNHSNFPQDNFFKFVWLRMKVCAPVPFELCMKLDHVRQIPVVYRSANWHCKVVKHKQERNNSEAAVSKSAGADFLKTVSKTFLAICECKTKIHLTTNFLTHARTHTFRHTHAKPLESHQMIICSTFKSCQHKLACCVFPQLFALALMLTPQ